MNPAQNIDTDLENLRDAPIKSDVDATIRARYAYLLGYEACCRQILETLSVTDEVCPVIVSEILSEQRDALFDAFHKLRSGAC